MNSLVRFRWERIAAGTALVLLAGFVCGPSPARADCGDYVIIGNQTVMPAQHALPGNSSQSSLPMHHHGPCSGPNCQRSPLVPPVAPGSSVSVQGEEWGQIVSLSSLHTQRQASALPSETPERPTRRGNSIYHPPRAILS
jgi:hypothetical protein